MIPNKKPSPSENKSISISGDVRDSNVFIGDNNTFIKKIFNIFKSDSETLEHRNRRILLGHVENAWIKGVLDASLHGAALLDLGIKPDTEAVTKYPWAIKKESTKETLPAGLSMLEIFDSIGMGRSLLILGAPGSGKTTMLLELTRGLIARAREDVTQPIPMVFNLASWTEKLTFADWLAQELNNLYSVPRKTAPDWVKGDKLLLLLDGLDEVRQESRAKCVEAINAFRKEHGLTSLAVCSRSQDYADLNAKLSFEGAIEVQLLTQEQIAEFFNRFGNVVSGIKQALEKDTALREMAETPLFLSIMIMAYRDKKDIDIWVLKDERAQRKHLFDTYIERMFERPRSKNISFRKRDILHWLSWLANKIVEQNQVSFYIENIQPTWLNQAGWKLYRYNVALILGLVLLSGFELIMAIIMIESRGGLSFELLQEVFIGWIGTILALPFLAIILGFLKEPEKEIQTIEILTWSFKASIPGIIFGLGIGLFIGLKFGLATGLLSGLVGLLTLGPMSGISIKTMSKITRPGERLFLSAKNWFIATLIFGISFGLPFGVLGGLIGGEFYSGGNGWLMGALKGWVLGGLFFGFIIGILFGGRTLVFHFSLRCTLFFIKSLPWRLVPFLDHCVDLIFLRRVGGGYIFVHRLLMEHFAEMYVETTD